MLYSLYSKTKEIIFLEKFSLKFFAKFGLAFSVAFLLTSCGPPTYEELKLLKNYKEDITFTKVEPNKDGAPSLDDIVGERFFNMFVFMPSGKNYTYNKKTYQHRVIIEKNSDGKTLRLKTSPIRFGAMPLAPIFSFDKLSLVKLSNGTYSLNNDEPGYGKFFTLPSDINPEGTIMLKYNSINLMPEASEVVVTTLKNNEKEVMIKLAFDFNQKLELNEDGYYTIQDIVTNDTPGYENFTEYQLHEVNLNRKRMIDSVGNMALGMKGATGTHCDYRIDFQGYRIKYTGYKARPYLYNKRQANYHNLPKTKVCYEPTELAGGLYNFNTPIPDAKVDILDAKLDVNQTPLYSTFTDATGTFKFYGKYQKPEEFMGGFYKIKFSYEKDGVKKVSYYPDARTYEDAEVVKVHPNTKHKNIFADLPGFRITIKPKVDYYDLAGIHKILFYEKDSNGNMVKLDTAEDFKTQIILLPKEKWDNGFKYQNIAILDDDKLSSLNLEKNKKYYIALEILKPGEYAKVPEGRKFWYRGPYRTYPNQPQLIKPVIFNSKNQKQTVIIPMPVIPYFMNINFRNGEYKLGIKQQCKETDINDPAYANLNEFKKPRKKIECISNQLKYPQVSDSKTFELYITKEFVYDTDNNYYPMYTNSGYVVGKKYKFAWQSKKCDSFIKYENEYLESVSPDGSGYTDIDYRGCEDYGPKYWLKEYSPWVPCSSTKECVKLNLLEKIQYVDKEADVEKWLQFDYEINNNTRSFYYKRPYIFNDDYGKLTEQD